MTQMLLPVRSLPPVYSTVPESDAAEAAEGKAAKSRERRKRRWKGLSKNREMGFDSHGERFLDIGDTLAFVLENRRG
jgi:hypothetical protein